MAGTPAGRADMVRNPELLERITPFVEPGEHVVGAFRVFRGPRLGAEALALAVNVPVFAFLPTGTVATMVICALTTAAVLVVIQALRQYILCAVSDRGVLLLDCGHVPGRWQPRALLSRQPLAALGTPKDYVETRIPIGDETYWITGAAYDEARRLARSVASQS